MSPLLVHSHYPSIHFTQPIKAAWFRVVGARRYDPLPAGNSSYFIFANAAVCVSIHQSRSLGGEEVCDAKRRNISKRKRLTCGALENHIYSQVKTAGLINDGSLFSRVRQTFLTVRPARWSSRRQHHLITEWIRVTRGWSFNATTFSNSEVKVWRNGDAKMLFQIKCHTRRHRPMKTFAPP